MVKASIFYQQGKTQLWINDSNFTDKVVSWKLSQEPGEIPVLTLITYPETIDIQIEGELE